MFRLNGVYAAMMTPVTEDKKPNEASLRKYVDLCIKGGVDGLFVISSVGEFVHFTLEDKKKLLATVVEQNMGRVSVVAGIGDTIPEKCVELGEFARDIGCHGAVICPPYYFPITQSMLKKHFCAVAEALKDFPIILYNIPVFTTPIGNDLLINLAIQSNVVGIKDSGGETVQLANYIDLTNKIENFAVLTGREEGFLSALAIGARGSMTVVAGIVPEIMSGIYKSYQCNDLEKGRELQRLILPLMREMNRFPFPIGYKAGLEARGIQMGPFMQPLDDQTLKAYTDALPKVKEMLQDALSSFEDWI